MGEPERMNAYIKDVRPAARHVAGTLLIGPLVGLPAVHARPATMAHAVGLSSHGMLYARAFVLCVCLCVCGEGSSTPMRAAWPSCASRIYLPRRNH